MEPMKGKWVSSRVYLGSTELFYIPEVQAVFLSSCERFLGTLWCSVKHIEAPYVFDWEHGIALHPKQGIRALTPAEGMSHLVSRVAAGTWGIFSSYNGDSHSKLHLIQRSPDSCLVRVDTTGS